MTAYEVDPAATAVSRIYRAVTFGSNAFLTVESPDQVPETAFKYVELSVLTKTLYEVMLPAVLPKRLGSYISMSSES